MLPHTSRAAHLSSKAIYTYYQNESRYRSVLITKMSWRRLDFLRRNRLEDLDHRFSLPSHCWSTHFSP